ncbi:MAG: IS4 family transposase [Thermodesulfobacteriota bacterium]|nr:IS4 family transposase [Thermodesulfobacteriota bacterium]
MNHIDESALKGFKYFKPLWPILKKIPPENSHPPRRLHYDQYLSFVLFYFFNPTLTGVRSIQKASKLEKVQKVLGVKSTSLGSFSEAGHVFDHTLLPPMIKKLAQKALPQETDPQLKDLQKTLVAFDGSLLPALPKMIWALWLDEDHKAAKLHLEFDLLKSVPTQASLTHGNENEKTILRKQLSPGKIYVLDAGYAQYSLLQDILKARSSFVCRLRDNAVWETLYEKELSPEDRQAGVQRDLVVRLGSKAKKDCLPTPVRVIEIHHFDQGSRPRPSRVSSKKTFRTTNSDYVFLVVTDLLEVPAEVIALIYRFRWQIELFFRWFKCILRCKHFLSLSENGLAIQIYCALIASLLISLWSGRKPDKRTYEMLCLYMQGWASDKELEEYLKSLKKVEKKKVS